MPKGEGITSASEDEDGGAGAGAHTEQGTLVRPGKEDLGASTRTGRAKPPLLLTVQAKPSRRCVWLLQKKTLYTTDALHAETIRHIFLL